MIYDCNRNDNTGKSVHTSARVAQAERVVLLFMGRSHIRSVARCCAALVKRASCVFTSAALQQRRPSNAQCSCHWRQRRVATHSYAQRMCERPFRLIHIGCSALRCRASSCRRMLSYATWSGTAECCGGQRRDVTRSAASVVT